MGVTCRKMGTPFTSFDGVNWIDHWPAALSGVAAWRCACVVNGTRQQNTRMMRGLRKFGDISQSLAPRKAVLHVTYEHHPQVGSSTCDRMSRRVGQPRFSFFLSSLSCLHRLYL